MTDTNKHKELEAWWWETDGTGSDACSLCRKPTICSWHEARLQDLHDLIMEEVRAGRLSLIDEAERGYHSRDDYPPFNPDPIKDRAEWNAYLRRIAKLTGEQS